jgi:FKBP-type peptidyl-prolyl cis-trans isomerase
LIDGSTFDEGEYAGSLESAIPGWQEGIPKIKTNGIMILRIPSSMGYGETGSGTRIPPHSTLIFEIELHESIN